MKIKEVESVFLLPFLLFIPQKGKKIPKNRYGKELRKCVFLQTKVGGNMKKTIFSQLESSALFSGLDANDIERHLNTLRYSVKKVPAKTVFISENDSLCEIIVVVEGLVSAGMSTAKGKHLMVDYLKAGTMLAPAFVYSDECEVPVEVKTIEKSVLFCMSKDDFSLLIGFCEPVRNNFIHILSHINFFLISKIRMVYMSSIKEKIATFLLRKATIMHCDSVPLSLSRRQLADVFGIQKSSLIRTLNELEHDNLIFVREKEIVILDAHGLQEILKG